MINFVVNKMDSSNPKTFDHSYDENDKEALFPRLDKKIDLYYTKIVEMSVGQKETETLKKCSTGDGDTHAHKPHIKITAEQETCFDYSYKKVGDNPYFKIGRYFFFGGLRRYLKIPLSMPNRVIVEPNEPRHGFSHMTWQGLNNYYLQNSLSKIDYEEILTTFKKTAFKAYSRNREENYTQSIQI